MTHWTTQSTDAFVRRITFDFWTQLQKRMDALPLTQLDLANTFGVSESAISQTLNNSQNPRLTTLVSYAKALKLNVAIVAYPDDDPSGRPVNSEIFTICWEKANRPRTFGQAGALPSVKAASSTGETLIIPARKGNYYRVNAREALTHSDLAHGNIMFILGAGASLSDPVQAMETAITQAPRRKVA